MTGKATPKPSSNRRLDQATEYVSRTWFPFNENLLKKINQDLASGTYNGNIDLLIQHLKTDFGLYAYCLKAGHRQLDPEQIITDPSDVINSLSLDDFKRILSVNPNEISSHDFAAMEKNQILRLKHLAFSAATAELIAEKVQIDKDYVYSCSVLRQLGINLIAWNYPTIYLRAVSSLRSGQADLDSVLAETLGFSPMDLGCQVTLQDSMSSELKAALGLNKDEPQAGNTPGDLAGKLCEIGEAFAILNDPDQYPTGNSQTKTVIKEINYYLGPKGVSLIRDKVQQEYMPYIVKAPELFQADSSLEKNIKKVSQNFGHALLTKNPYIPKCPDVLQKKLRDVYSRLVPGHVSTEGIQVLISDVMPAAGFTKGCIYLLDPKRMLLVPRLRIGQDSLSRYKPYNCSDSNTTAGPIVEAFFCFYPIRQEDAFLHGDRVSHISGALGVAERAGVLYLEMSEKLVAQQNGDSLLLFKATRQCLNDCLSLK